jgi:hypothetical protein
MRQKTMAKKKSNEGWIIVGLVIAGFGLLYLQTGFGNENDSAVLPNTIESKIDALVAALNDRFGHDWVELGAAALEYQLRSVLPPSLVVLIGVVVAVEKLSKQNPLRGDGKLRLAVQMARS